MSIKSGLAAQVGIADEGTVGTFQTPVVFIPFVSEKLERKDQRLESKAIIPGRRAIDSTQWAAGKQEVGGAVQFELLDRDMGKLFKHAWGAVATAGSGPYTHTFTPGDHQTMKSLTVQVGRPDTSGTVQPFSYLGSKVSKLQIAAKAGEIVTAGVDFVCMSETTASGLAAASGYTGIPMTFVGASLTVGGSALKSKAITFTLDNHFKADRWFNGQATTDEPLEEDLTDFTFNLGTEFANLTNYTRVTAATSAALVATFAAGSNSLVITSNVRFDGETPNVAGTKVLDQPLMCKAHSTTDAGACTAVYTTTNATV